LEQLRGIFRAVVYAVSTCPLFARKKIGGLSSGLSKEKLPNFHYRPQNLEAGIFTVLISGPYTMCDPVNKLKTVVFGTVPWLMSDNRLATDVKPKFHLKVIF
jgi:hypothetical protein